VAKVADSVDGRGLLINNSLLAVLPLTSTGVWILNPYGHHYHLRHFRIDLPARRPDQDRGDLSSQLAYALICLTLDDLNWHTRKYYQMGGLLGIQSGIMLFAPQLVSRGLPAYIPARGNGYAYHRDTTAGCLGCGQHTFALSCLTSASPPKGARPVFSGYHRAAQRQLSAPRFNQWGNRSNPTAQEVPATRAGPSPVWNCLL